MLVLHHRALYRGTKINPWIEATANGLHNDIDIDSSFQGFDWFQQVKNSSTVLLLSQEACIEEIPVDFFMDYSAVEGKEFNEKGLSLKRLNFNCPLPCITYTLVNAFLKSHMQRLGAFQSGVLGLSLFS